MAEDEKIDAEDKLYAGAEEKEEGSGEEQKQEEKQEEKSGAEEKKEESSGEEKKEEEVKEEKKVPEKYELKLQEGSLLTKEHLDETAALAKERGLSNEEAQQLVDRDEALLQSNAEKQQVEFEKVRGTWFDESKADPEIGGEAFTKSAETAKRVVDRYGSQALKDGLNSTGFGNHPELIRLFVNIGSSMNEDQLVIPGAQTAAGEKDMATVFYGDSK